MVSRIDALVSDFDKADALDYLASVDFSLSGYTDSPDIDYNAVYTNLIQLVEVFCKPKAPGPDGKIDPKSDSNTEDLTQKKSHAVFALLSRNIVAVLAKLPNKVYDTANTLLPFLVVVDGGELRPSGQLAATVLIDILQHYPTHLPALINFAATLLYKIVKKSPVVDSNIAYLLSCVLTAALKSDIDEKFQVKWIKLLLKAIANYSVTNTFAEDSDISAESSTVMLVKYYVLALKSVLVLLVSSHYQLLLEVSTSSASGSKLKPEALMAQQHTFQMAILTTHEKLFGFCLLSQFREIRASMVDLLLTLLVNFVDTGKFNAYDYLLEQYPMPALNLWSDDLMVNITSEETAVESRRDNLEVGHDSDGIIAGNTRMLGMQIGVVEVFVMFAQLQLFQNWDYYPSQLCTILDSILSKFGVLESSAHIQNQQWVRTLDQWRSVVEFLVKEGGSTTHDILVNYVATKFQDEDSVSRDDSPGPTPKAKRRESVLFSFKKKTKAKDPTRGINPYVNGYQLSLLMCVVEYLLPYGLDFSALSNDTLTDAEKQGNDQSLAEEEDKHTSVRTSYVSGLLLSLLTNNSQYVRNYSLASLLKYAQINHSESNLLILEVFLLVLREHEGSTSVLETPVGLRNKNVSGSATVRVLSYSLALLALIKQSDATVLQNSTIAKILSFCTQNLKQSSNLNKKYLKNAACWLVLSSLVNFHADSEFVKLNSSQFLVFWKNLLTSQFISSDLNGSGQGQLNEIINNLKLRSLSLVCLLNYISSVQLTPDLSKQLQFLLVKSHKYLIYLESNLEHVGLITSFNPQAVNECEYNVNLASNLLFSNFNDSSLSADRQLISLILYNKMVILRGFVKLLSLLKSDVNSSLVVFLMKVFADPKSFSRLNGPEHLKDKAKATKKALMPKVVHEDSSLVLLDEDYNYNFGVTSKFNCLSSNIDELNKIENDHVGEFLQYSDPFGLRKPVYSKLSIESSLETSAHTWMDHFETMVGLPAAHSVNYDPIIFLLLEYSFKHEYATNLVTSLIDLSIELFQLVFPNLSYKIQFSLLEQLRASLTTKHLDPLRKRALSVNVTIAVHGLLNNMVKKGSHMNEQLITFIIDIVNHIETRNVALSVICADCNGLATSLLPKSKAEESIAKFVNEIIGDTNPHNRGVLLLSLSKINQYCHIGFSEVYNVISQLLADPHPVMSYYSLMAAGNIAENILGNQSLVTTIIGKLYANFLNDNFGFVLSNKSFINMRSTYSLLVAHSRLLKLVVTSLGPSLRDSDDHFKRKVMQMLLVISYGIGSTNLTEYNTALVNLLTTFQELLIFDSAFVNGFPKWFDNSIKFLVTANLKTGLHIVGPTSINKETIFPVTTSFELYEHAYSSMVEMTKMGYATLDKDSLSLAWISMELQPCSSLRELIMFWMESKMEILWFSQLTALFKISVRRLVGSFIETQYQQKLLPLLQRQKKKAANTIDFKDEEVQNIVNDDEGGQDKNEPITWEFRQFIYDLLIKLLSTAQRRPQLVQLLTPKIQEIVRMAFLGTTAPISSIKLRGIDLLDKTLSVFGELEDPLYPSVSILEQQQAQIISALIPCFGSDSDPDVIVKAINVSSKFINLPRIKFYSKQRILKTLIYLLEEISSNKFLKFVFLESMAEYGRKAIQLSILNCWANLRMSLEDLDDTEPEFQEILDKYSDLLISLWILLLKDFSTTKYNQPHSKELQLYSTYWLNFVGVLSLELEKDPSLIRRFLVDEESNFFFVMFCQCAEALIKNQNVSEVLHSVIRLVQIPELVQTLFSDELFGEVVDLLDRLVLMEDDPEIKCEVVEIVSTMQATLGDHDKEKLFELLRVTLLPLFDIFPFLRLDFSPENAAHKLLLKHCNSATNLLILKKLVSVVVEMILRFDSDVQNDLASCVLYIFAKIYEHGDDGLVGVVLPFLKTLVSESPLAVPFLDILRLLPVGPESGEVNYVLTMLILVTGGGVALNSVEVETLSRVLVECLQDSSASTAVQAIKSLIKHASLQSSQQILKNVLKLLLQSLARESGVDPKIAFEIVFLFTQSAALDSEDKVTAMYAILVPLLLEFDKDGKLPLEYLSSKMLALVSYNASAFKTVVNDCLDSEQKLAAEKLVKLHQQNEARADTESEIELKHFA